MMEKAVTVKDKVKYVSTPHQARKFFEIPLNPFRLFTQIIKTSKVTSLEKSIQENFPEFQFVYSLKIWKFPASTLEQLKLHRFIGNTIFAIDENDLAF